MDTSSSAASDRPEPAPASRAVSASRARETRARLSNGPRATSRLAARAATTTPRPVRSRRPLHSPAAAGGLAPAARPRTPRAARGPRAGTPASQKGSTVRALVTAGRVGEALLLSGHTEVPDRPIQDRRVTPPAAWRNRPRRTSTRRVVRPLPRAPTIRCGRLRQPSAETPNTVSSGRDASRGDTHGRDATPGEPTSARMFKTPGRCWSHGIDQAGHHETTAAPDDVWAALRRTSGSTAASSPTPSWTASAALLRDSRRLRALQRLRNSRHGPTAPAAAAGLWISSTCCPTGRRTSVRPLMEHGVEGHARDPRRHESRHVVSTMRMAVDRPVDAWHAEPHDAVTEVLLVARRHVDLFGCPARCAGTAASPAAACADLGAGAAGCAGCSALPRSGGRCACAPSPTRPGRTRAVNSQAQARRGPVGARLPRAAEPERADQEGRRRAQRPRPDREHLRPARVRLASTRPTCAAGSAGGASTPSASPGSTAAAPRRWSPRSWTTATSCSGSASTAAR